MTKEVFEIDYVIKSSPRILYDFVKLPTHLSQWFCDSCDHNGDEYIFMWKEYDERAMLIDDISEQVVAYRWLDSEEDEFFEFAISKNEISGDTVLTISDFAEPNEVDDQIDWWENQIQKLRRVLGG